MEFIVVVVISAGIAENSLNGVSRSLSRPSFDRPQQYTSDDLTALLLMILKVHLDVNFMQ